MAEALENTALAAWVNGCKARREKAVYNIAGRSPFASQKTKTSKAPCSEAWGKNPSLREWFGLGTGCEISLLGGAQSLPGQGPEQPD